ncbi:hypothetical protein D6783_03570 [Candidatus Woesearchaeota archaeon]|nr:MAG: hypothetical protein D6783_03570 [Candidatus Woesearchaeota archaeon]
MGFLIRYKGVFDMEGLYRFVRDWLIKRRFDVDEVRYKAKWDETELKWKAELDVDEYYTYFITIDWHFWDVKDVHVQGKTLQQGRFEINLSFNVSAGNPEIFPEKGNNFHEKLAASLGKLMHKLRENEKDVQHIDTLHYLTLRLHTEIKKFLNMHTNVSSY